MAAMEVLPDVRPARAPAMWAMASYALAVALAVCTVGFALALGWRWQDWVDSYTLTNVVIGLALVGSGAPIGWFRPRNAVGPVFALAGLAHLVSAALGPLLQLGITADWPPALTRLIAGFYLGTWSLGLPSLAMLALLLFPDGRLPGRWWRVCGGYLVALGAAGLLLSLINPYDVLPGEPASRPLFAIEGIPMADLEAAVGWLSLPAAPLVLGSLILRYRRGAERVRRQLLWLLLALIAMLVINLPRALTGDGPILALLSVALIPLAIAIAIVRYRLLDIRFVLSRTVLYLTLIALIAALFAGVATGLALVMPADADRTATLVAAVGVAMVFMPLRQLLQRVASRALFGSRDDPVAVATSARSAGGLDGLVAEVRQSMRLPRLALVSSEQVLAEAGREPDEPVHALLPVGADAHFVVTLRAGERRLHDADRRVLGLVGGAVDAVLREQRLIADVRHARAQTAEARERERQLLHRELHDGLGPTLTGAAMYIDAATNLLETDPGRARAILRSARGDVATALHDVRRVVYGLRPLALDEKGLVAALDELGRDGTPPVTVQADALPPLSPAVELAGYRIAAEAITNARRHASARRIQVRLAARGHELAITVDDDGTPPACHQPGAGLRFVAERAEELGGWATAGPRQGGGWRLDARLPIEPG